MPQDPSSSQPQNNPSEGPISQKITQGMAAAKGVLEPLGEKATSFSQKLWERLEALIEQKGWLILIVAAAIWLLPGNNLLPLVDRDEPRFAYATEEMMARDAGGEAGAWVVPTFNDVWRFDKPPLVYWWMRLHYMFGGYNEFWARLHSVVAATACVLLVYLLARRMYGTRVGFWSGFAFLTCLQVFEHGRLCVADMPMMLFTLAAMVAGWELWNRTDRDWKHKGIAAAFWLALALGFATKWVVPPVVVGVAGVGFCVLMRQWPPFKNFYPIAGVSLFVAISLAWMIPAYIATGGEFFKIGLGEHVVQRGAAAMNARSYNPVFYILTAFVSLLPWIAGIGGVWGWLKAHWGPKEKFLAVWAVTTLAMFSVAATQLPHYTLPAFAPILILIVAATGLKKPEGRWAGRFFWGYYAMLVALLAVGAVVALSIAAAGPVMYAKIAGIALVVMMAALVSLGWARAQGRVLTMAVAFLIVPVAFMVAGWSLRQVNPALAVDAILTRGKVPQVFVANGFEEPSLTAYTQHAWVYEGNFDKAIAQYNEAPTAALFVQTREIRLESIPAVWLKLPAKVSSNNEKRLVQTPLVGHSYRISGVNLGRFSWVEATLFIK